MDTLKLILPTMEYAEQIMDYRAEMFAADSSMDGCGHLRRCETAEEWMAYNASLSDPATLPEGRVLSTQFITVRESDNKLVGMLQVRHTLNDYLRQFGGHIGYSVRPSERRKGYATEQLRQALIWCREELKLDKVLITCYDTNEPSRRTILKHGGVYVGTSLEPDRGKNLVRYWIWGASRSETPGTVVRPRGE